MEENLSTNNDQDLAAEDPEQFFKMQLNMIHEFVDMIRTRQMERLFTMSDTKELTLDGVTYHRKLLTASQHRRLIELDTLVSNSTDNMEHEDLAIKLRKAQGEFYFGLPPEVVDAHYEEIEDILDSCLLKTYTGIKGSEINIKEIMDNYRKRYDNSLNILSNSSM